ncbi:MAG TPA: DUF6325 family protein [Thermomicrobiales bacterium]|nr:DUF6325 family protein [Thermomicrobiales bacterium]
MDRAPVDFVVVRFPGTEFSSDIAAGLVDLTRAGTIRIVDLLFLVKDERGESRIQELTDLDDAVYQGWDMIVGDVAGYLTDDDALLIADSLQNNSSAVLALVENTWAKEMVRAITDARGEILISERIPRPVVEQLVLDH